MALTPQDVSRIAHLARLARLGLSPTARAESRWRMALSTHDEAATNESRTAIPAMLSNGEFGSSRSSTHETTIGMATSSSEMPRIAADEPRILDICGLK